MRWALLLALALQGLRACKGQSATASATTSDGSRSTQTVQTTSVSGNPSAVTPTTAPTSSSSTSLTSSLVMSPRTGSPPAGPTKSSGVSVTVAGGSSPSGSAKPTTVAVGTTTGGSPSAPSGALPPSTVTPNPTLQPTTSQTLPVTPADSAATSPTTVTFSSPADGAKRSTSPGHVPSGLTTTPSPKASPDSARAPFFPKDVNSTVTSATPRGPSTATGSSGGTTGSARTSKEPTANVSKPPAAPPTAPKGTGTTAATNLGQTQGTTTAQSPRVTLHLPGSGSGPEATAKTVATTSASRVSPAGDGGSETHQAPFQIKCAEKMPQGEQPVLLTLNVSRPCEGLDKSPLKEPLLEVLCKAVKPNFNQSRDSCTVRLASNDENQKNVAVLEVAVRTISVTKELFESLAMKKGELEKIGVTNITHAGRTMDVDTEDRFSMPLIITIVCMAASLLLVAAIYGCCHQRISQRKDQQRLTEELQTMENGYHDNPTLEVMETSSEMQEKKVKLNGELGDSWIVPMDNLTKEDLEEEEDTHL